MLVTMKEILDQAREGNYGVTAPNIFDFGTIDKCIETAEKLNSPVIIDINWSDELDMEALTGYAARKARQTKVPVAINLDHGGPYEDIIRALALDFTSVMIDRSRLPFEENLKETAEVVKVAHALGKTVESELGHVGNNIGSGMGEGHSHMMSSDEEKRANFTRVDEAIEFVERTGIDCLAVAIGTAHGLYPKGYQPEIDFELLKELREKVPVPLVLHGGSGSGDENLARACREGINKVNIASDLMRKGKEYVAENHPLPEGLSFVKYILGPVQVYYEGYGDMLAHYMELLGCAGKGGLEC